MHSVDGSVRKHVYKKKIKKIYINIPVEGQHFQGVSHSMGYYSMGPVIDKVYVKGTFYYPHRNRR